MAKDLGTNLACTHAALRDGRINEYRAMIVVKETGYLDRQGRADSDEELRCS